MPRLLSLNTYHYRRGGSDVVFLEHDAMFRALGWNTAVMTMHHPRNESSAWSGFFVNEIEFDREYGVLQKIVMAGKVIYSLEARSKLRSLLDRFPADVAHAHCIYHHISPSVLVELKKRGIPTVMTAHDLKLTCPAYKMRNHSGVCEKCRHGNLLNLVINRCVRESLSLSALIMIESSVHRAFRLYKGTLDRVITPSMFYRQKFMEWGWPERQLVYIPNYIDTRAYASRPEPGEYFLYFGRLSFEKGISTLIRAAAKARIKLRVAGVGPEQTGLQSLAGEVGGDIEFLGFVDGRPLRELICNARAIILPSEWYENAPMCILEAHACGKPVIGARIGGIPEMIVAGETGALFQSGNVEELVDLLRQFADMPESRLLDMGKAARTHVCRKFTAQRYQQEMLTVYSDLGVRVPQVQSAWSM